MSLLPTPGERAPWLDGLLDQDGAAVDLEALRGRPVVLYFYPKDDTPGCTIEACGFRDAGPALDAVVLGVSGDDAASHQAFRAKFSLPFPLVVDAGCRLARLYGVFNEAKGYPSRATFLIDAAGAIVRVWSPVKPDGHAAEVATALSAMSGR